MPYHPPPCGPGTPPSYSQAVDHGASLSTIILLLPLLQPADHFEQGALGGGRVPVGGPADVLEVLDDAVPILRLRTERASGPFSWGSWGVPWGLQHRSGSQTKGHPSHVVMGRALLLSMALCTLILLP